MIKIIILDDEPLIRDSILKNIDWDSLDLTVCGVGENGYEGIELVKEHHPHLILTDIMMPGMNGLDFLQWVHDHDPNIISMVLTGYQDFDFAQKAISVGVKDFILKPTRLEALMEPLAKNVRTIKTKLQEKQKQTIIETQLKQSKLLIQRNYVNALLFNPYLDYEYVKNELNYFNIAFHSYVLLIVELNEHWDETSQNLRVTGQLLIHHFLDKNLTTSLGKPITITNPQDTNQVISIIPVSEKNNNTYSLLTSPLEELYKSLEEFNLHPIIGISLLHNQLKDMRLGYQEAKGAIEYGLFLNEHNVIYFKDCPSNQSPNTRSYTLPEELLNAIESCNTLKFNKAHRLIMNALNSEAKKHVVINNAMHIHMELNQILKSYLSFMDKEDQMLFDSHEFSKKILNKKDTIAYLDRCLKSAMAIVAKAKQTSYHHVVNKVLEYIEQNATEKITLNKVAEEFFFSPEHLSRLIKKSTGQTFTELIHHNKVDKAKAMLDDPTYKIVDIAYDLGFSDYRYFSQIFKKCTGITPSQYRQKGVIQ